MSIHSPASVGERRRYCGRCRRRHLGPLGLLALAVLGLHGLLLRGVHDAVTAGDRDAPAWRQAALHVRSWAPEPPVPPVPPARAEAPPPAPAGAARVDAAPRRPTLGPVPAALPPSHASAAPVALAPASADEPPPAAAAGELPIYPTLAPPAFAFGYDLRRGALTGSAELHWQPQGERYQARLAGVAGGARVLTWESAGAFDGAGLAPVRYTDRRRGGSTQAANFRREAGKVTFSGPAVEHALPAGAQDRLSWMLQLAAIAAADPARVAPGGQVTFLVVGARGDADVWTFVAAGEEALALGDRSVPTLRLQREPRRPYDTRAEVWLDPARHYLPVRARLSSGAERDELQLVLREELPPR